MISNFFLRTFAFRDLCRLHRYLSDAPVAAEASKLPLAQQKRFKDIERLLQVHKLEDWYKIRSRDVVKAGGGYMLMNLHRGSLPSLVVEMHPNHRWESWRWPAARGRTSLPASAEEIRAYLQSLKPVATSQDMTEFLYALTPEWLKCQPGGLWLMRQIPKNESLSGVVGVAFPEFDWKPELFAWSGGADKVAAVKRLASRLGISQLSGWYDIDPSVIQKDPEGKALLGMFKGSLPALIALAYPAHHWEPWRFRRVPAGFWNDRQNQAQYFAHLAQVLKIADMTAWYSISGNDFAKNYGATLLKKYRGSVADCLTAAFPDHQFNPWLFKKTRSRLWTDPKVRRAFFDSVSLRLGLSSFDEWNRVTKRDIVEMGGAGLLEFSSDSLTVALRDSYPEHQWLLEGG